METDTTIEVKRNLEHSQLNLAQTIRSLLPEIERKIEQGVKHPEIVKALNNAGIQVNLGTFRTTFYRVRNKEKTRKHNPQDQVKPLSEEQQTSQSEITLDQVLDKNTRADLTDKYMGRKRTILPNRSST